MIENTVIDIPTCKFCLEPEDNTIDEMKLVNYCNCKGSVKWTHQACLNRWLQESKECKECKTVYTCIDNKTENENKERQSWYYKVTKKILGVIVISLFISYFLSFFQSTLLIGWLTSLGLLVFVIGWIKNLTLFKFCIHESRLQNIRSSENCRSWLYHFILFSIGIVLLIISSTIFFFVGFVICIFEIDITN